MPKLPFSAVLYTKKSYVYFNFICNMHKIITLARIVRQLGIIKIKYGNYSFALFVNKI